MINIGSPNIGIESYSAVAHRRWDQPSRKIADFELRAIDEKVNHSSIFLFLVLVFPGAPAQGHFKLHDLNLIIFYQHYCIILVPHQNVLGVRIQLKSLFEEPVVVCSVIKICPSTIIFQQHFNKQYLRIRAPPKVKNIHHIVREFKIEMPERIFLPKDNPMNLLLSLHEIVNTGNNSTRRLPRHQMTHIFPTFLAD